MLSIIMRTSTYILWENTELELLNTLQSHYNSIEHRKLVYQFIKIDKIKHLSVIIRTSTYILWETTCGTCVNHNNSTSIYIRTYMTSDYNKKNQKHCTGCLMFGQNIKNIKSTDNLIWMIDMFLIYQWSSTSYPYLLKHDKVLGKIKNLLKLVSA